MSKWGAARYAANAAFIAAQASFLKLPKAGSYFTYAQKQLNYLLGDTGRSYVVGFGRNSPKRPHHRQAILAFCHYLLPISGNIG